jgi:hypothetical protein
MKYPITLSDSTPYYEKHFLLCEDKPSSYVAAFREAQYEALQKRRTAFAVFWVLALGSLLAWVLGYLNIVMVPLIWACAWALVSWRNRHEAMLLARTFELALRGKERSFRDYMWRHLDRRLMWQDH